MAEAPDYSQLLLQLYWLRSGVSFLLFCCQGSLRIPWRLRGRTARQYDRARRPAARRERCPEVALAGRRKGAVADGIRS